MPQDNSHPLEKSGFYYPNMFARIYFLALHGLIGEQAFDDLLTTARIPQYIGNYPPNNLERQFDFAEFAALNIALETLYGESDGRNLALQAGRNSLPDGLKSIGRLVYHAMPILAGRNDLDLKKKVFIGLPAMMQAFRLFSDQETTLYQRYDHYTYIIERCPVCWGRHDTTTSVCHAALGLLEAGLKWVCQEEKFQVIETECHAKGDEYCVFEIYV